MEPPSRDELAAAHCWEPGTDLVAGQPEVAAFSQQARLHQSKWRQARGYPAGTHPYRPAPRVAGRVIGSRLEYGFAVTERRNLLSDEARAAARARLATPEPHQMIHTDRLWCDLLSSMPLCFNLFGPLSQNLALARQAVKAWFPDAPGEVAAVHLEWSPGRLDPAFLGNRSAFDAAIELDLGDGTFGILGVETKYHEHLHVERRPSEGRLARYTSVAHRSGLFPPTAVDSLAGDARQQIWQDHLLALAMLQHPDRRWTWARFVLVYPQANPSLAAGACDYAAVLSDCATFTACTLDSLLAHPAALPSELAADLRDRYLW